jgi:hypothetical protein
MHFLNMVVQLILSRERPLTDSFAAHTSFRFTPIHDGCSSVSSVVVPLEVVPSGEGLVLALCMLAAEHVGIRLNGVVYCTDRSGIDRV